MTDPSLNPALLETLKRWAKLMKTDILTGWYVYKDPATPWICRMLALVIVAYALSPIDLIPDFIPVLGYLDDLLLIPLAVYLLLRITPAHIVTAARARAITAADRPAKSVGKFGLVLVLILWCLIVAFALRFVNATR